ncbi:MAG: thiamine pyrophosphate-dependent dehydrogenase E1 component subunit alpha [Chloroflexi bacterium]|nr:thiamine pyrophosphate-dependent dehydrogenase E1 component subunit alpha [Chloroflexota bacterium]
MVQGDGRVMAAGVERGTGGALVDEAALLRRIYEVALLTRAVDERLWLLSRQGRVSFVLTPRGHEIAQIASAATLRRGRDSAWPYYRDMAVGLALGISPYEIFLGALGRAADPHSGSRQLTMHLSSPRLRIGSISSEIASHIPQAVGAAYAARVLGEDSVAVCWFGDGATSEGDTHEAMNLAGIHRLPVVFICENNGLAISVPLALQMAADSFAARAAAYRMPGERVDGTDALAVYHACRAAMERARRGDGPSVVEVMVPRMTPHSSQDDDAYRTDAERAEAVARDPLPRLRRELLTRGLLDEAGDAALRDEIGRRVVAATDRALAMPEPAPERARRWLYAGDPPHPELRRLEAGGIGPGYFDDLSP